MEAVKTGLIIGFIIGLFAACSTAAFTYKYYGLSLVDYSQGKLLGPEEKDDLSTEVCKPTESNASPCIVMRMEDFFQLKADYERKTEQLKSCQLP